MLAMDAAGVLKGYRAVLDWAAVGKPLTVLVKARAASPLALQDLIDRVRVVTAVQAIMTTLALSSLQHGTEATR
jgi:DNA-binding Lrp family transcriptional regulator